MGPVDNFSLVTGSALRTVHDQIIRGRVGFGYRMGSAIPSMGLGVSVARNFSKITWHFSAFWLRKRLLRISRSPFFWCLAYYFVLVPTHHPFSGQSFHAPTVSANDAVAHVAFVNNCNQSCTRTVDVAIATLTCFEFYDSLKIVEAEYDWECVVSHRTNEGFGIEICVVFFITTFVNNAVWNLSLEADYSACVRLAGVCGVCTNLDIA